MIHYQVYIIYSASRDKYYVGHSHDVQERLRQHNAGRTPSTKTGRPWILKYTETFNDKSSAAKREVHIKKMKSRQYIESLIHSGDTCQPPACRQDRQVSGGPDIPLNRGQDADRKRQH